MAIENDIEKWLRRELCKDRDKPVDKLIIRHAAVGHKGNDVASPIDLSERHIEVDNIIELAEEVLSLAQSDADGLGHIQRYVVSLHLKGENKAISRYPFRLRANQDEFDEGGDEPASVKGIISQQMRHNEALAKTLVHAVSGLTTVMARRLESSDQLVNRMMQEKQETLKLLEDAKSEQHTRDMELLGEERKSNREDKIFEKVSLLVPVMVNKIAGQKVFNAEDPMIMMLKSFTESLNVEQFTQIQKALTPEQLVVLAQIIQTSKKALPPNGATS